ncbi:MAG: FAD/NAD(P)-binding protein [Proteobacteria bacterium]|nr:FAD/NAD(P)-binding protein [Pseudomonadota bacterium]
MTELPNPYLPDLATIIEVVEETETIKTFRVVLDDKDKMRSFSFIPGQVAQLSVFGTGESTFVINSPPTRMDYLQFSVMKTGEVTNRLHTLCAGDHVGIRAPLGNGFDVEAMRGRNLLIVGGGIGMAPLRTLILYVLDNREDYGNVSIFYGARTPDDFCFKEDLEQWEARDDVTMVRTVDSTCDLWGGCVGMVPNVLLERQVSSENCIAVTCGPPVMIKYAMRALDTLGFPPENIVTTLEKRMKCGVGLCGRCNIGHLFVCKDGPVFTKAALDALPQEF